MRKADFDKQLQNRAFKKIISAEVTDQQNLSPNTAAAPNDTWQSITTGVGGQLTGFAIQGTTTFPGMRLRVYEGEGTGGTLLGTITGLTLTGSLDKIDLSSLDITFAPNFQYSIRLDATSLGFRTTNNSAYSGGRNSLASNNDFIFETYMTPINIEKDNPAYTFPAAEVAYYNSSSGLAATNVQDAITENVKWKISFNTLDTKIQGYSIRTYSSLIATKDALNESSWFTYAHANGTDIQTEFGVNITAYYINKNGLNIPIITKGRLIESVSSVVSVVAATGITTISDTNILVESSTAGDTIVTATPPIVAGIAGQRLVVWGTDDTKTVTFTNGNGIKLDNGQSVTLGVDDNISFTSIGSNWVETSRTIVS